MSERIIRDWLKILTNNLNFKEHCTLTKKKVQNTPMGKSNYLYLALIFVYIAKTTQSPTPNQHSSKAITYQKLDIIIPLFWYNCLINLFLNFRTWKHFKIHVKVSQKMKKKMWLSRIFQICHQIAFDMVMVTLRQMLRQLQVKMPRPYINKFILHRHIRHNDNCLSL